MIFNSIEYLVFFAVVATLHFVLPQRVRWVLLLIASYVFYMRWNPYYLVLILASTLIDYGVGIRMADARSAHARRVLLGVSLSSNLGLLFTFKYWNFFDQTGQAIAGALGATWPLSPLDVLLPVGISFYTFQTLGYTIDIYRGRLAPERHLGRFALFVSFFPQLVAGPIERASHLIPQFRMEHRADWDRISSGLQLALWGLFKKVVIADRLAIYVDAVYSNLPEHGAASYLLATYFFAFQIYCDFSGYTDIAIGCARVLGYDLMKNFERPYFAWSVTEFWHRWHISLSTWLRDYLYISMGGNRRGALRTYRNLLVTMVLGGLWHGASWNFVIWGTIHGALLALSRATLPARDAMAGRMGVPPGLRRAFGMFVCFHLVCLCWIFFRAATLADSFTVIRAFAGPWHAPFFDLVTVSHGLLGIALLLVVQIVQEQKGSIRDLVREWPMPVRWLGWYALIAGIALFGVDGGAQFIYFQF